jgi:hypothetical protein
MKQIEKIKKIYLKYKLKDKKKLIDEKFAYRRGRNNSWKRTLFMLLYIYIYIYIYIINI